MNPNKKAKLRQKILATFSIVLFLSFFFVGVIFNIVILFFSPDYVHYYIAEGDTIGRSGLILLVLVAIMFVISVAATYFLSNSITKPIEKLSKFATRIGNGNFEANDYEFSDIELEGLNSALNKSVRQLEAYDKSQKDFFQNASHELRTPLMSIKVYAEGIVYGLMDSKEAGKTILEETDKLSELITDLIYIAKIDNISTIYRMQRADLIQLIQECASRQQIIAQTRGIKFTYDFGEGDFAYDCVYDLISRAIDNLISNAIRYAKSEIILSCKKVQGTIQIVVSDDGTGIEAEIMPHIFERFYKGNGGNTGIGLAIVKSIADQHKGNVTAKNQSEGGAVFTITLPAQ